MRRGESLTRATRDGSWLIVRWAGDIDMANTSIFEQQTLNAVDNSDDRVTVDLSDVAYIDSAGIRTLVSIRRLLADRQIRFSIIVPEDSVLVRALQVGGVMAVIPTFTSEAAAREAR